MSIISNFRKDKVDLPIGSVKEVITGNNISNVANTTSLVDNGLWIPSNAVYAKSAYPELFSQLGNINARGTNQFFQSTSVSTSINNNVGVDITYGLGLYVAGFGNSIHTSTDLINWTSPSVNHTTNTTVTITRVVYGNGVYVYSTHLGGISTTTDLKKWTRRTSGTSSNILDLVYGSGVFVYVGAGGVLATSGDGITWSARTSGTTSQIDAIIYNSGLFLYGAANGHIRTSTDAITWTPKTSGTTSQIRAITYGNGLYLIGGAGGMLRTSTDTTTWSASTSGTTEPIRSLAYGNGLYVYTASDSLGLAILRTSANASTWKAEFTSYVYPSRVLFANSGFHVVHDTLFPGIGIWNSANATSTGNWGAIFIQYKIGGFTTNFQSYTNDKIFYTTSIGEISYSDVTELTNFGQFGIGTLGIPGTPSDQRFYTGNGGDVKATKGYPTRTHNKILYQNGTFAAIGFGEVFTSTDGLNWNSSASITNGQDFNPLNGGFGYFDYQGGRYIIAGSEGFVATSTNLTNWSYNLSTYSHAEVGNITYDDGKYVVISHYGGATVLYANNNMLPSFYDPYPNTIQNWGNRDSNTYFDSTFGNAKHVVVGSRGAVFTSANGYVWNAEVSGTSSTINAVAYGNGLFAYGTANGGISTSTDGASWTARTSGTTSTILSLTYGNSRFVYGGFGGVLRTSTDGISWNAVTSGTTSTIYSLTYGNGLFVYGGDGGALASSTDALTWTARTSGTTLSIAALQYGNGVYLFGANTLLRTSTNAIDWTTRDSKTTGYIMKISYGNGAYICASNATAMWAGRRSYMSRSTDGGVNWIPYNAGITYHTIFSGAYGNGLYVFLAAADLNGIAATTTDLINWDYSTYSEARSNQDMRATVLTYNNGYFIAATSSTVAIAKTNTTHGLLYVSKNGKKWHTVILDRNFSAYDINYNNGVFTIVGGSGVNQGMMYYCDTNLKNPIYSNSWVDIITGTGGSMRADTILYQNGQYYISGYVGTTLNIRRASNTQVLGFASGYDSNTNFLVPDFTNRVVINTNVISSVPQQQLFIKAKM